MKNAWIPLLMLLAIPGCKVPAFIQEGTKDGVTVSYRWSHRPGYPSELLLKIANASGYAQHVKLGLDVSFQTFTVEELSADTCIPAGRVFNGKLNGIYFIPRNLTPEQAASPDTQVQLSVFDTERMDGCP
ncbi:MAG: hypothetical protein J5I62_06370 [Flavobacteriales bacterium]|nr:hypothetical protein [Flavobacteriales bacterium]MEB2341706.1 hypothetical protein [Flavobacteriia bacterium]